MIEEYDGSFCGYDATYNCSECGKEIFINDFDINKSITKFMEANKLCHECAFWEQLIQNPNERAEIINGHYFIFLESVHFPDNLIATRTNNGKEIYARKFDGTLLRSNNVCYYGKIPERFRNILKDTSDRISLITYTKLKSVGKCNSIGCFDRYNCLCYQNNERIPFNKIPKNYKENFEECPSFVSKNNFKLIIK